jgi:hypothetical protein
MGSSASIRRPARRFDSSVLKVLSNHEGPATADCQPAAG